jgi:hypothetical protein
MSPSYLVCVQKVKADEQTVSEEGKVVGVVSRFDFRGLEQDRLDEQTGYWERM